MKSLKCNHSNKSLIEQYFPVLFFIMLYKVVLTFGESLDKLFFSVAIRMQAISQYFPVVLLTRCICLATLGVSI